MKYKMTTTIGSACGMPVGKKIRDMSYLNDKEAIKQERKLFFTDTRATRLLIEKFNELNNDYKSHVKIEIKRYGKTY
tara:strand:- start:8573 stop:8803 length:231 start_codon:yes stop_codon:yes gene_type:complete